MYHRFFSSFFSSFSFSSLLLFWTLWNSLRGSLKMKNPLTTPIVAPGIQPKPILRSWIIYYLSRVVIRVNVLSRFWGKSFWKERGEKSGEESRVFSACFARLPQSRGERVLVVLFVRELFWESSREVCCLWEVEESSSGRVQFCVSESHFLSTSAYFFPIKNQRNYPHKDLTFTHTHHLNARKT